MKWSIRAVLWLLGIGTIAAIISISSWRMAHPMPDPSPDTQVLEASVVPELITESFSIRPGDTLADMLGRAGLDETAKSGIIAALKGVFDVRKLRAGTQLILARSPGGTLESVEYLIDSDQKLQLSHTEGTYEAEIVENPGIVNVVSVCGTLQSSLFESLQRTGERPELALKIADIFAWDIDFYTDPQEGDEFCILLEKKEYLDGQPPAYLRILAAKYNNTGTMYEAFLFTDKDGKTGYFSADGRSLQAAFLRSPMKFEARVSSRFSPRRFHPVLKRYRPHLGTDYAAPTGTPVQAVAAGTVIFSGYSGASGNLIKIRHANGYETGYLHLSRRFVKKGQRVAQGDRIGLVGATGLATGPHLDFRISRNGKFVDFERLKPPRATEIGPELFAAFAADRDRYTALLQPGRPTDAVMASGSQPIAGVQ